MPQTVIYEYDPATGQTLPTSLGEDFFPAAVQPGRGYAAVASVHAAASAPHGGGAPGHPAAAARRLSKSGKDKVRRFVAQARSLEELVEVEAALDAGAVGEALAVRLGLTDSDFELLAPEAPPPSEPQALPVVPQPAPPLAALGLTPSGLAKVRHSIQNATDMGLLAVLDRALKNGDIPRLRDMLALEPEDLQGGEEDEDGEDGSTEASDSDEAEEDDYDPFVTEPDMQPVTIQIHSEPPPPPAPKKKRRATGDAAGALGALQGAYDESEDDESSEEAEPHAGADPPRTKKKRQVGGSPAKEAPKMLAWPIAWAWLLSRTQRHPDFRAPHFAADWVHAREPPPEAAQRPGPLAVAIATSLVYVGDPNSGYDPSHLGRLAAVSDQGEVLLDVIVRPRSPLLDCRTHATGLTREMLEGAAAVAHAEACSKLLSVLRPETILVCYRASIVLETLKLWHRNVVDVALLFEVESRKQHQFHALRHIAQHVLGEEAPEDPNAPHDALETAQLTMRLAQHEASAPTATPAFAQKPLGTGSQIQVRHIPREWGDRAANQLLAMCPGAAQGPKVTWALNEADPTDWRGEAVLTFPNAATRDAAFDAAPGLVDVHVQWQDAPGAPPLGAFLTEQGLVEAFSRFGVVVAARIPRKALTREPLTFAFISFLAREDAQRVAKEAQVEVEITAAWKLALKPRLAKYGHTTDKRVAVQADGGEGGDFAAQEWVHLSKR